MAPSRGVGLIRKSIVFVVAPVALLLGGYTLVVSHPAGADPQQNTPTGFGLSSRWGSNLCTGNQTCATADVNGDGKADAISFVKSTRGEPDKGDVLVGLSTGKAFGKPVKWADQFCLDTAQVCTVADVNGDGKADAVTFVRGARPEPDRGDVFVALSTGKGFGKALRWSDRFCVDTQACLLADVNGDGKADAVVLARTGQGGIDVALSTGRTFGTPTRWAGSLCAGQQTCAITDVTGDGKADAVVFTKSDRGDVQVARSTGKAFGNATRWMDSFCTGAESCTAADLTGDGRADAVSFVKFTRDEPERGDVNVALSNGSGYDQPTRWSDSLCTDSETCQLADVDGDHRADAVLYASNGAVTVARATGPTKAKTNPGASTSARPNGSVTPSGSAGANLGAAPNAGSRVKFHPSTEAPPCNCTTPTNGMTAIANAIRLRSASVSTVMVVPGGLPVTETTEISLLFDTTRRISQTYDRVNGNRISYNFDAEDAKPRSERVDINLLERGRNGPATYHFVVTVPVEALYDVKISPLTFTLQYDCDDFGESEPEVQWADDRGNHRKRYDLDGGESGTDTSFARSQPDARLSYGMEQASFAFDELDFRIGLNTEILSSQTPLLPSGSFSYRRRITSSTDRSCAGFVEYQADIQLETFDLL